MLPMAIIWGFANILVLSVNGYLNFWGDLWLPILIRAVYLWIAVFLLGLITVMLAIATKSKLIAFFISFGINSLSFTFVISRRPSLFLIFPR
ncbi:putative membrane protein [Lacticaseibacillus paracasei]|nr:putative membrane protein [Lacticaseibacillus paracasei]